MGSELGKTFCVVGEDDVTASLAFQSPSTLLLRMKRTVGTFVGASVVGTMVGCMDGCSLGDATGVPVGAMLGVPVGGLVGDVQDSKHDVKLKTSLLSKP